MDKPDIAKHKIKNRQQILYGSGHLAPTILSWRLSTLAGGASALHLNGQI
jgi:hypothetical protein